jgi:hypothetical protein
LSIKIQHRDAAAIKRFVPVFSFPRVFYCTFIGKFDADIRQDVDLITARINYRWGGPIIAKY